MVNLPFGAFDLPENPDVGVLKLPLLQLGAKVQSCACGSTSQAGGREKELELPHYVSPAVSM